MSQGAEHYYLELAAAFVRGRRPDAPELPPAELVAWGLENQLRLHKFKRDTELPRVRRVFGLLRGLMSTPSGEGTSLVDLGSGRGTFLWPLLAAFPELRVTAVDIDAIRARDLQAVADGGIERLAVLQADARVLPLPDRSADVVTLLEVLEHLPEPERAARRAVAVARRAVIASVPSKPDDNPEHIHLFDERSMRALFAQAGARRVSIEYVLNHMIVLVQAQG
jgi:2-polyprenyl-3-methyl-5-hydroxy-6-metoxy-1,4-benzoquinol methylase